jgi:multiple sugar transport system permease protein
MKKALKRTGMIVLLGVIGVFFIFPLYWILITSFKLPAQIFVEKPIFILDTIYLDNYLAIFQKSNALKFFINSVTVSLITTMVTILLATMCGFALARYRTKTNRYIKNSVLIVRMIPAVIYTIPYYVIYSKIGLLDSLLGLIIAYINFSLPLAIWLAVTFFEDIPKDIYESAQIDGCSEYRLYFSIAMPLVMSGIVVIGILVFIGAWNEFGLASVLQASDLKKTLPVGIASMVQTHKDTPSGSLAAAGMIAVIPAIILSLTSQKYIVKGMMAGSVKG